MKRPIAWLVLASVAVTSRGVAAPPKGPAAGAASLAIDVVELKGTPASLRGAVLSRAPDGALSMAVSRNWLRATHPEFSANHAEREAEAWAELLAQLDGRIEAWIDDRRDDAELAEFLASERNRLRRLRDEKKGPPEMQFVLVELPASRVKKVTLAASPRKHVGLVAWQEELTDVESRSADELAAALKKDGVDVAAQEVDLTGRLPAAPETDRQWAARRAIVEHGRRKQFDFQGTGDVLVRTGDGAATPQMATLIAELLRSQVQSQLDDLLGPGGIGPPKKPSADGNAKATRAAEADGARGVRITRVQQDLAASRVRIEQQFLARMPDGSWLPVWTSTVAEDASKPRPDAEQRIAKDPQVRSVLGVVRSLGLGADADDAVTTAIRFGAAVMEAQKSADGRFYRFRDHYLGRLDSPPLPPLAPPP